MADRYEYEIPKLHDPAIDMFPITPDTDPPHVPRAIYVGAGGDLTVETLTGTVVTMQGLLGGMTYPVRIRRVLSVGTTAGGILGLV